MDEITIRPAEPRDLELLLAFEQAIIETERRFDPTIRAGNDVRYYDLGALISSANATVLVAELDSEIIASGYARIDTSEKYLKHSKHSYLGFMYVSPDHRGKGLNGLIVNELEDWSRSRGVTEMRLEVYAVNSTAIKAYEKSGYDPLILTMRKGL